MKSSERNLLYLLGSMGSYHTNSYSGQDLSPHPYFKPGKNKRTKPKKRQMTTSVVFFFSRRSVWPDGSVCFRLPPKIRICQEFFEKQQQESAFTIFCLTFLPSCAYFRLPRPGFVKTNLHRSSRKPRNAKLTNQFLPWTQSKFWRIILYVRW